MSSHLRVDVDFVGLRDVPLDLPHVRIRCALWVRLDDDAPQPPIVGWALLADDTSADALAVRWLFRRVCARGGLPPPAWLPAVSLADALVELCAHWGAHSLDDVRAAVAEWCLSGEEEKVHTRAAQGVAWRRHYG